MAVGGEDESTKSNCDRKMNLREASMKYGRLVVFIRHDSAEICIHGESEFSAVAG
jgi:thiamine phosphate synthase YjbQ (UPF0047 family)